MKTAMRNTLSSLILLCTPFLLLAQADDKRLKELQEMAAKKTDTEGWVTGGAIGLDFAQLAMFNPRVGSGDNRIAVGGLGNMFANYKRGKVEWVSNLSLQLAAQQLAAADWQKSLDVLRLNSKFSYQSGDKRWSYAGLFTFESLTMPTWPGNFLRRQAPGDQELAQFLSPFRLELSPGINFKPDSHWSFFLAPGSYKMIYVANQDIADLGIHGTRPVDPNDPSLGYRKDFQQFGARLVANYSNKFLKDKLSYAAKLDLFSNYLNEPGNLDILWQNDLGWQLWKGLSLNFLLEASYDDDILVYVERPSETLPDGRLGKRPSWTQALVVKYSFVF